MIEGTSLAAIRKQIEQSEKRVERQRRVVEELKGKGHATMAAKELLSAFESSLRAHRATYGFLMRREAMPRPSAAGAAALKDNENGVKT
jgi:hypothetical protein